MSCTCGSARLCDYGGKTSDMNDFRVGGKEGDGYVPYDMGIGGGDYVEFTYCLDCGRIQGKFPLPKTELEEERSPQDREFFCGRP